MCKPIVFVLILSTTVLFKFIDTSNTWRYCPPCRCFGDKRADCSQEKMNLTLTNIPEFLSNEIEVLNITRHKIIILENDIFYTVNLTNLWKVYLDKCAIKTIEKHAFRYLEQMTDLSLMHNEITTLDGGLFSTNTNLKYLWLDNNKIKKLPSKLFSELLYLSGIYARFNLIENVEDVFTNHPDLWIIDLSNNKLQYLNATLINNLKGLKVLFLHENIWSCDCRMKILHEIMLEKNLYNLTKTVCTFPEHLKGKELKLLVTEDFKCWQHVSSIPTGNLTFYEYTNTTFSCEINALPKPEFFWLYNNTIISENNTKYIINSSYDTMNDTLYHNYMTILNMMSNDTGLYSCKINNSVNQTIYQNIHLTVLEITKPSAYIIGNYLNIKSEKNNYNLSCIVTGMPKPDMYWTHNDTNMITLTNNQNFIISEDKFEDKYWLNLTIKHLTYNFKGQYTCNAKYAKFVSSNSVTISVPVPFTPEVKISAGNTFKEKTNVTLSCFIKTYSTPNIIWKYNNSICSNSTKYNLFLSRIDDNIYWYNITIINITSQDVGNYMCGVKSKEDETEKSYYIKNVIFIPKIKLYSLPAIFENMNCIISCYITAYPNANITWKFNSTYLNTNLKYNITTHHISETIIWSNLSIYNTTEQDSGLYYCRGNNTEGYTEKGISLQVLKLENDLLNKLWYLIIILGIIVALAIIIILVFLRLIKRSVSTQKADISEDNKKSKDDIYMTEIPLEICHDDDSMDNNLSSKEEDIMYIMERELKSYNVTECEK